MGAAICIVAFLATYGSKQLLGTWVATDVHQDVYLTFDKDGGYELDRNTQSNSPYFEFGRYTVHGNRITMKVERTLQPGGVPQQAGSGLTAYDSKNVAPPFGKTWHIEWPTKVHEPIEVKLPFGKIHLKRRPEHPAKKTE